MTDGDFVAEVTGTTAHLVDWHHLWPPYEPDPETAHGWLHEDATEPNDTDHPADQYPLPTD